MRSAATVPIRASSAELPLRISSPESSRKPTDAVYQRTFSASYPSAVRAETLRILRSEGFVRSKRMQRFLSFIVEEVLAGRAAQLCEYTIGMAVFDQNESFEPALNPIVRNDARRLRQKLLEYYKRGATGASQVVIDIPKGGYVPVFSDLCCTGIEKPDQQWRISISVRSGESVRTWTTEYSSKATDTVQIEVELSRTTDRNVRLDTA